VLIYAPDVDSPKRAMMLLERSSSRNNISKRSSDAAELVTISGSSMRQKLVSTLYVNNQACTESLFLRLRSSTIDRSS
jgi:hypothetical protein